MPPGARAAGWRCCAATEPPMPPIPRRDIARLAYLVAALHLAAAVSIVALLQPGLPAASTTPAARQAFQADHLAAWWLGWLVWHAAGIALVALYVGLAQLWRPHAPLRRGL